MKRLVILFKIKIKILKKAKNIQFKGKFHLSKK
jgi:hypothetical protein